MRLLSVQIAGYKRFSTPQVLYLGPPVVAVVGPNEAGKTSLLAALAHVTNGAEFGRREFTGRRPPASVSLVLEARYRVEPQDREGLEHILDKKQEYTFTRIINSDSSRRWTMQPWIKRDLRPREELCARISAVNERGALLVSIPASEDDPEGEAQLDSSTAAEADALAGMLSAADEDLGDEQVQQLTAFKEALKARADHFADTKRAQQLFELIERVEALEREANPKHTIYQALDPRIPRFLEFDAEQRELRSDYPWEDHPQAPAALANLLALADISYDEYRSLAIDRDRRDELNTEERALNQRLAERLDVWSQHDLTITLKADAESLAVHVTDEDTQRDVPIEERSAGLQMFAALLAFCARYADYVPPILLFDEAETHLHYGAQADLVHVFETQNVAQAVIYTTHSIGCLPGDLGRSIRVVAPTGDEESEIRNEFWSGGVGLTPLMLAMGAPVLAFLPARYAVISEGPSDAILLPSLLCAAGSSGSQYRALGFQVAPGAAEVPEDLAEEFETEAGNVAYLFDADEGGRQHAAKVAQRAHDEGRVLFVGDDKESGLCTEDLLAAETYAAAVNEVLNATRSTDEIVTVADLPACARPAYVEDWCQKRAIAPLSKTRIAERALRLGEETGLLINPSRKALLQGLHRRLRTVLKLK